MLNVAVLRLKSLFEFYSGFYSESMLDFGKQMVRQSIKLQRASIQRRILKYAIYRPGKKKNDCGYPYLYHMDVCTARASCSGFTAILLSTAFHRKRQEAVAFSNYSLNTDLTVL